MLPSNFAFGTTYLVVAKYNVDNLDSALYVLDTCSDTEPAVPLVSASTAGTPVAMSAVAIRQGGATSSPAGTVDGIRVADNWASAATCTAVPPTSQDDDR